MNAVSLSGPPSMAFAVTRDAGGDPDIEDRPHGVARDGIGLLRRSVHSRPRRSFQTDGGVYALPLACDRIECACHGPRPTFAHGLSDPAPCHRVRIGPLLAAAGLCITGVDSARRIGPCAMATTISSMVSARGELNCRPAGSVCPVGVVLSSVVVSSVVGSSLVVSSVVVVTGEVPPGGKGFAGGIPSRSTPVGAQLRISTSGTVFPHHGCVLAGPRRTGESVDVLIEVEARRPADEVRSLRQWLLDENALRGRVRLVEPPVTPGTLGSVVETLAVALGPGGVATAAASVLIAWIRRRTGDVTLKVTQPDGSSFELSATNVQDPATAVDDLARRLSAAQDGTDGTEGTEITEGTAG
jgi:hypothetical protein